MDIRIDSRDFPHPRRGLTMSVVVSGLDSGTVTFVQVGGAPVRFSRYTVPLYQRHCIACIIHAYVTVSAEMHVAVIRLVRMYPVKGRTPICPGPK